MTKEELIERMAKALYERVYDKDYCPWEKEEHRHAYFDGARAALAVAEPVIREQCARIVEKGNYETRWTESERAIAAAIREGGKDDE